MKSELDRQYERLLTAFADIELIERSLRDHTKERYRSLFENSERLQSEGLESLDASHHNMTFRSLAEGRTIFYRALSRDSKQLRSDLLVHQNKQYQWLLADAYEWFADYIEFAYAAGGHAITTLWRPFELRKLQEAHGANPSLDEYLEFSANSRETGDVFEKLNRFRTVFKTFRAAEERNLNYRSTRFVLVLVEMLRHVIVHNSGRVRDKQAFIERTLSRAGASLTGKDGSVFVAQINHFLATLHGESVVHLLDVRSTEIPGAYASRIGVLLDLLLAYANFIHSEILSPAAS